MSQPNQSKFPLGRIVATQNALYSIALDDIQEALRRHSQGDWGDLDEHDLAANEEALADHGRILSAYLSSGEVRFWIITERDRSSTIVLLPTDY